MADLVFNIAKGRTVEYYNRVESSDPTNAVFEVFLATGSETDDNVQDADTITALFATTLAEATFTNYASKVLSDAELAALPSPDDTNNRYEVDLPDQTWTSAGNGTNNTLTRLIVGYDSDSTGGTDANIIPCTAHDFSVTTDGSDLTAQFNSSGFFRAA